MPTALRDANRAAAVRSYSPPMSVGGAGLARPEVTRKFVMGLFCGGTFHDVAFTRVGGCDVVRLHDWELRMRKVARSFFPEEGVVRDMDIRAGKCWMLACWKPTLVRRCLPTSDDSSAQGRGLSSAKTFSDDMRLYPRGVSRRL